MKRLLQSTVVLLLGATVYAQNARVQVVHNSADLAAETVDVYVNDVNTFDDFEFRTATPFVDVPADVEIELSIAPGNSTSVADALLTVPVTLADGETYVVVAYGIASPTGYNPAPPLSLEIFAGAREAAADPSTVDVLVHHGSTDAPTVDIVETGVGAGTLVDDISTSEFAGYVTVPAADYNIEVRLADGVTQVAGYSAPLATLGLEGAAITVYASGFLDPSQNSNGPAFGLYAASAAGGPLLALPEGTLGLEDVIANSLAIYPNPTTDLLTVEGINREQMSYTIADVQGRIVADGTLFETNQISTSTLSQGVYVLNLSIDNQVIANKKFIKE